MQMRTVLLSVLALLFFAQGALAENRALIVGIGTGYDGRNRLPDVTADVDIARDIARMIGIPPQNTRVIVDREATRTNMIAGMRWVQEGVRNGGRAFIYYSGHGYQIEDVGGRSDDEGCDEVLVPVDVTSGDTPRWLLDKEINDIVRGMPRAEVLLMADSCFSGTIHKGLYGGKDPLTKSFKSTEPPPQCGQAVNNRGLVRRRGIGVEPDLSDTGGKLIVLSATGKHEVAYPTLTGRGGSLFSQAVYDTLKAKGVKISFKEVIDDAREQVRRQSEQVGRMKHTPQLDGNPEYFDWAFDFSGRVGAGSEPQTVAGTDNQSQMFDWLVNNSQFAVSVVADKRQIRLGERISFNVHSSRNGYVNILDRDANGVVTVLFPNQLKSGNAIQANTTLRVPEDIGGFKLVGQGTPGQSEILVLVTSNPFNMYEEMNKGRSLQQLKEKSLDPRKEQASEPFVEFKNRDFADMRRMVSRGLARSTRGIGVVKDSEGETEFGANGILIQVTR